MDFHLTVTNYVGSISTLANGLFVILIISLPPDNLGMFRSQYYVGAFASFFFAATQLWSAFMFVPNGTLFVCFPARVTVGTLGFLLSIAATILQFTMLSSNFAVRFAAVRGYDPAKEPSNRVKDEGTDLSFVAQEDFRGWMKDYLTNHFLFYGIQFTTALGAYIPLITLMSPTPELRAIAHATYGEKYEFDFLSDYYFVSSYEHLTLGNIYVHQSMFIALLYFELINFLIMMVCGTITYLHIARNTQSKKLRDVNNRLLRIRILQALFSFAFLFMPGLFINSSMLRFSQNGRICCFTLYQLCYHIRDILQSVSRIRSHSRIQKEVRRAIKTIRTAAQIQCNPLFRIMKNIFNESGKTHTEMTVSIATVHHFSKLSPTPKIIHLRTLPHTSKMDFHLTVTNYVGSISTLVNGLFLILILSVPPDNLGMFRSQYYVGAFASFFFAATQLWSAYMFLPNGTLFIIFPARATSSTIGFLSSIGATNLQFTMLSYNFAVRFAAVRGGWMKDYLTNTFLFYGIQLSTALIAYIPLIILLSPTPELRYEFADWWCVHSQFRAIAHATYGDQFNYDFLNGYYFHLIWGNIYVHQAIFISIVYFESANLLLMLVCGTITYLHIARYTHSKKLRQVNNRLLRIRIMQALFSFAFLFMPGLFINSSMLLRVDASTVTPYLSSVLTLATFFNPFLDIALTPGYRKKCVQQLRRIMKKVLQVSGKTPAENTLSIATLPFSRHSPTIIQEAISNRNNFSNNNKPETQQPFASGLT
ncbi:hypothetical protein PRIPAC_80918 [Pristionchus pacificus]|uniref:G protein-coupled receptor n=1 Tax=Pristionchus pacificus TaxID=54126 RepID=A0A2A6CK59_PRIPA|nr:hypothetical protein PRIPAC_80918 [Pristionchus pacificus]|eukprot:PDM78486.1 G protein-coupled receptor [Pristionchus pacificus]